MQYIEYIQIFLTLVLGLALTRIIKSYANIIKNAHHIKFYWPYFAYSFGLLMFVISDFWTGFERSTTLTVGSGLDLKLRFVLALITPVSYTLIAELMTPKITDEKILDLKEMTAVGRKTAFIIGVINIVITILNSLLLSFSTSTVWAQFVRLSVLVFFIIGIFSKNEIVQKIIAVLFFLASVAWFLLASGK